MTFEQSSDDSLNESDRQRHNSVNQPVAPSLKLLETEVEKQGEKSVGGSPDFNRFLKEENPYSNTALKIQKKDSGKWQNAKNIIHQETSSEGYGSMGTIGQEMIDLVDNLIDSSPNTRADRYSQKGFNLKIKGAENPDASPLYDSTINNDFT